MTRRIPCAMTAAPRTEDVQARSIYSTLRTGFRDLTIFAEPGTDLPSWVHRACHVIEHEERLGEWHNWLFAARWMLDEYDDPVIVTVQDDVLWCHNVEPMLRLSRWPSDECGALHLYTSRRYAHYPRPRRSKLSAVHSRRMAAACGIAFTRSALEWCLHYAEYYGWRGHTSASVHVANECDKEGLDIFIGEALTAGKFDIWVHNPSLGQHIAKESTLGHGGPYGARVASHFVGEHADAMEIYRAYRRSIQDV